MHYLSNKLSIDRETTILSLMTLSPKLDHLLLEVGRGTWLTAKLVEEWLTRNHWKVFGSKLLQYKVYILLLLPKFLSGILLAGGEKWLTFFLQKWSHFSHFLVSPTLCQRHLLIWLYHTFFLIWELTKRKEEFHQKHYFIGRIKILSKFCRDECKSIQIYLFVEIFTGSGIFLRKNGGFWIWRDSAK